MKNIFTPLIIMIGLAGLCLGQAELNTGKAAKGKSDKPRIAVLEFTAEPNMGEGSRSLQSGILGELTKESKLSATAVSRGGSSAIQKVYMDLQDRPMDPPAAVRIGKLLGVNYVLAGHVKMLDGPRMADAQLIEIPSGKVIWLGQLGPEADPAAARDKQGSLEKAVKPVIQKLTASLKAADL